jgi:hypothetical protein
VSRRGDGKRIYHHSRGRRARWGFFTWVQFLGMAGGVLLFVGYVVWLYVLQPAWAAPVQWHVWLPVVGR